MNIAGEESEQLARGTKWIQMVGELGMVSVGGGDQVMGIEAGEERGLVLRTGVSHSDVSGRTWARVTGGCVQCSEARSVEVTRSEAKSYEVREPSVSKQPQSNDASQDSKSKKDLPYYTSQDKLPRPSPELAEAGERILQVRTLYYLRFMIDDKNIIQDTGRSMASMAVGSVARATLGRLVGPTVASAVGGAVMQEINRRAVVESLTSQEAALQAGQMIEEDEISRHGFTT